MTKLALIGAGGKMGMRLSINLKASQFEVRHVEINTEAAAKLERETGVQTVPMDNALDGADAVILAVPDTAIGELALTIVDKLAPGTMIVVLDAAAPFAGQLPQRQDINYFVTHPCHPSVFNHEANPEDQRDFFGGTSAKQAVTCALMQGPDEAWQLGEEISRCIYQPVTDIFRLTVEQMALLEPVLSETVCGTLLTVLREATDEAVTRGVPYDAARAFVLGHANIMLAVLFGEIPGRFSDACNKAIENGKPALMRPDWKDVFEPEAVAESIRRIT